MIRRAAWIRGLAEAAHVADHGDRARAGVVALQRPRGAGGIVRGGGDGEIGFHIPFKVVNDGAHAFDSLHGQRIIGHFIGEHVPVAGRSLGVRSIGPKLGEHARVVAALHVIGCIRQAGDGIGCLACAVVGAERIVAHGAGRDIDDGLIIQLAAGADDTERLLFVFVVGGAGIAGRAEARRTAKRIEPGLQRIHAREAEWNGGKRLHTDKCLRAAGDRNAILRDAGGEVERLPEIWIGAIRDAETQRHVGNEVRVHAEHGEGKRHVWIHRRGVSLRIGRAGETIGSAPGENGLTDALADLCGSRCRSSSRPARRWWSSRAR